MTESHLGTSERVMRPVSNRWLLAAILREGLRDLETETNPPNIVAIVVAREIDNLRHGAADS